MEKTCGDSLPVSGRWLRVNRAEDRRFHFDFLTSELLTKDYTETYYREDGSRVTAAPEDIVRAGVLSPDPA